MVNIGQALGLFVSERSRNPSVVIGRDTRPSGEKFLHCLTAGLTSQGVHVVELGLMTTPGVAFFTKQQEADLGVIVSASHNPLEYNGIKLVRKSGLRLQREDEMVIESLIDQFVMVPQPYAPTIGQETDGRHLPEIYIQDHIGHCPVRSLKGFSVILDCAKGATSIVAAETFRRMGADVVAINESTEGDSINFWCGSEYVREHPEKLLQAMQEHGAQYGFAFDGDGDRLVVVDADGHVFDGHDLLYVLANYYHSRNQLRHHTIVATHQANRGLADALQQLGLQTIYTGNGDKNVESAMWGGDYLLGGEPGGNIIINDDHHTAADAIYTALVLAGVLVQKGGTSLAELAAPLKKRPQVTQSLKDIAPLSQEQSTVVRDEVKRREAELGPGSRILTWWASTEPGTLRVMVEGTADHATSDTVVAASTLCQFIKELVGKEPRDE